VNGSSPVHLLIYYAVLINLYKTVIWKNLIFSLHWKVIFACWQNNLKCSNKQTKQTKSVFWVHMGTILTKQPLLSAKLVPTFADRGVPCSQRNGRNLRFLGRSHYFLFWVVPQLHSRGWVDPIPDPLLLRKSGSAGNRTRISGSVARNSDH
jgi:hypothetical protein